MTRWFFVAIALACTGCPSTTVVCNAGLSPCGTGCADFTSDRLNCGACNLTCQQSEVCVAGQCQCQAGALACRGQCVLPQTDPAHCGGCLGDGGVACPSSQVCEQGQCKNACVLGTSQLCGQSCTDTSLDPNNCGACGVVCAAGLSCHGGHCTWDVIAACSTAGEIVGVTASTQNPGPLTPLGSQPFALSSLDGVLLSADQTDLVLYEANLTTFARLPEATAVGHAANQVLVDGQTLYVVNSTDNTLQILRADAGADAGGTLGLATVGELNFGPQASPEWSAKVGNTLFVTLYGGFGAAADAGQKVAVVDVTTPTAPALQTLIDLSGLNLSAFDGGVALARPQTVLVHNGQLYAVLNNLDGNYAPAGPGLLAKIDPSTHAVSLVGLGGGCLDPLNMVDDAAHLYVACSGHTTYDASFNVIANDHSGVVMLSAPSGGPETVLSMWSTQCPSPAPADGGCQVPVPSTLALSGTRLFVGDSNGGRVFTVDVVGNQLVENRGYGDGGSPLNLCPPVPNLGFTNVGSLFAP